MDLQIDTPVQYLKGVGPKLAEVLSKRGIFKLEDLLEWYPRSYEDRRAARSIASLQPGETVSLLVQVLNIHSQNMGRSRRKIYTLTVGDSSGKIQCKFFRVPYRGYFQRFQVGQTVRLIGKVTHFRNRTEFHHPDIRDYDPKEEMLDALVPLYSETEGLSSHKLYKIFQSAIQAYRGRAQELMPKWLLEKYKLVHREEALIALHSPPRNAGKEFLEQKSKYHYRIIFEEFFWLELFLAARRKGLKKEPAIAMKQKENLSTKVREALPFELTDAQKNVLKEIEADMSQPHPMQRLLQGDVGSGKTLVALISAAKVIALGHQVALMAPTEILATQHYSNAKKFLESHGVRIALLTGMMKAKEKQAICTALEAGKIDLIIGTHALIQETVEFQSLAYAIVDEQHRFGVAQRLKLQRKGIFPHVLVMTATPIPRTLAMTVYGDLDFSVMKELPKGRKPILTKSVFENKRRKVYEFLRDQIEKGRQAYIVYPLVEESEKLELKDAVSAIEELKIILPSLRFALLHGRMKDTEKSEIMQEFRAKKYDVLVSTTVIEVGVDVPNASMMIIEHSERFGLSQLHQLRGRVGRGEHKSYCVLMLSYAVSEEAKHRAQIMVDHIDGFRISEEDLKLRGPGEFMGTRQSGLPGFRMANLIRDVEILKQAREAAFELLHRDPHLRAVEHQALREEFSKLNGAKALAGIA